MSIAQEKPRQCSDNNEMMRRLSFSVKCLNIGWSGVWGPCLTQIQHKRAVWGGKIICAKKYFHNLNLLHSTSRNKYAQYHPHNHCYSYPSQGHPRNFFPQRKTTASSSVSSAGYEVGSTGGNNNTNNNTAATTYSSSNNRNFLNVYEKQRGSRGNPFESVDKWELDCTFICR